MDYYQEVINILKSDESYKLKSDIMKLIDDGEFLKKIIHIHNPIVFDRFIKMCEFKLDTSGIYELRNKFIKKSIWELNQDNIYSFFELDDLEESRKKIIANRYLIEYIIGYYFQDNFYNFITNFYLMTNYLSYSKKNLVDEEHIKIYKSFVDLKDISMEDKVRLFTKYLNDDLMSMFYDDINIVREDSHKELVNSSLKLDKDNGIYQVDLSNKYGVDVYYLNGEEFYGFVRTLSIKSNDLTNDDYVFSKKRRLGYSFSYISNRNIGTMDYYDKNVLLFYDNINYQNIMYVHHTDMYTGKRDELNTYLTDKENEIVTPSGLISKTINYNEIYIKSGDDGIKPTALVCYDVIKEEDIAFAKKYNLSILLINKEKYQRYTTFEDELDSNTYVL